MNERYMFIKYKNIDILPVIKDREVIELFKEIAREYLRARGIEVDGVRVFNVTIKVQPFVGDEPRPFHTINIAVILHN